MQITKRHVRVSIVIPLKYSEISLTSLEDKTPIYHCYLPVVYRFYNKTVCFSRSLIRNT